ncbi:MAG: hypothetical protein V2A79_05740 [Planctomycetota bacterium]
MRPRSIGRMVLVTLACSLSAPWAGSGCAELGRPGLPVERQAAAPATARGGGRPKNNEGAAAAPRRGPGRRIELTTLESAIERAQTALRRFVPTPDPIESLYFGWFDRPYSRATIAVAVKTVALLERELHFRRSENGLMCDAELAAMLDWLDSALERATQETSQPDFRPHRLRGNAVTLGSSGSPDSSTEAPPRFAFMDRASATRYDRLLGDFDLLACLGTGAYGLSARTALSVDGVNALGARAQALGIGIVAETADAAPPPVANRLLLQQVTLGALLSGAAGVPEAGAVFAVVDPPQKESWGESLARRSLLHAAAPGQAVVVTGWLPPRGEEPTGVAPPDAETLRLAMWVHALAGQRLGVIEGWRDLRDGSKLPYAPLLPHPAQVETIVHTALDLLYFRREVAAFAERPGIAVVLDASAVSQKDANLWSPEAAELFNALLARQLVFDVVPATQIAPGGSLSGYRVLFIAAGGPNAGVIAEQLRATANSALHLVVPAGGGSPVELCRHLQNLPEPVISRDLRDPGGFAAYDSDGGIASGCLVFSDHAADGTPCFAVANLQIRTHSVVLERASSAPSRLFRDVLTGDILTIGRTPILLDGYQVRLFMPAVSD